MSKKRSLKLIRMSELVERIGVSKMTIYRWVNLGRFPKPLRIGLQAVAWREDLVDEWILDRPEIKTLEVETKECCVISV